MLSACNCEKRDFCCSAEGSFSIARHTVSAYWVVNVETTLVVAMPMSIAKMSRKIFVCCLVCIFGCKGSKKS